jgi:hypothetical protein
MNLDAGSILVIVGSVVASAGVIGKSRLERWDAAVNQMVFGKEALFRVIARRIDGFLQRQGIIKFEAQATLGRALTLTGLIVGITGLLVSKMSGP